MDISVLLPGIPIKGSRGYLGWSTVTLIMLGEGEGDKTKGAVLCDTGSYGDRHLLQEKLRETLPPGMEINTVVLTHLHFDHAQNVDLFPEARVVLSRREWEYVRTGEYREAGDTFVPAPLITYLEGLGDRLVLVEEGDEIAPGIFCVMLPGHTPGSLGLWLQEVGTMILGDAVKNGREYVGKNPGYHFATREDWLQSRERVEQALRIIPGHDVPYNLEKGKIIGFDPATPVNLEYTPFRPSLDTLVIDRGEHSPRDKKEFAALDLLEIDGKRPQVSPGAYVDPTATLVGEVVVEKGVGIWPGVVIRGDEAPVVLKAGAMVLENAVVEAAMGQAVTVEEKAIISHGAVIHGAQVGKGAVVGIGAMVLDKAVLGEDVIVGSGALVAPGKEIGKGSLVLGMPGKVVRELGERDLEHKEKEWEVLAEKIEKYRRARGLKGF